MLLYANEKNLVEDSYSKYITERTVPTAGKWVLTDSSYSPLVQTHVNTITRVTKVLIIYGGCQSTHATFYGRRKVIFIEAVSNLSVCLRDEAFRSNQI
ncbi:hypothetical protein P8452_18223 [Trifolium repens]|nr:hypothetical protein P8452_18223 [Trifolium repens]